MRLIFVRHGEPDYAVDGLTPNGVKEAEALAKRTASWKVDEFFCSPMGRAQMTAAPTLKVHGREAITYPWLREFHIHVVDPTTGEEHGPWDLMPQYVFSDPYLMDPENWYKAAVYENAPEIETEWHKVCDGLDGILKGYGYTRRDGCYWFEEPDGSELPAECEDIFLHGVQEYQVRDEDDEKCLVFFCHFGVTALMLSHLIGVSPAALWHGTCIPPTGITVVNVEKRLHNACFFRTQSLGDCSHLLAAGLPVSGYAAFSTIFQQ